MLTSPNRLVALIMGAFYVALGAAGFAVTGDVGLTETPGRLLLGLYEVNPLRNLVELAIGVTLVLCGFLGRRPARGANIALGTVFLAIGLAGLFVVGTPANILALSGAGNVLDFFSSVVLLAVGLGLERPPVRPSPRSPGSPPPVT